jgi:hypothetical protein
MQSLQFTYNWVKLSPSYYENFLLEDDYYILFYYIKSKKNVLKNCAVWVHGTK